MRAARHHDAAPGEGVKVISAPAKLTVSLRITGLRSDGYHLLDSEMASIDLADTLEISDGDGLEIVEALVGGLEGHVTALEDNLVTRALLLLERRAFVRLTKRIPPGAGLGGGSSDAAAILRWSGVTDPNTAARLGADVPFCVRGGRARVRGVGEIVQELPFEDREFVLLLPPVAVSTRSAYRAWDRICPKPSGRIRADGSESAYENDLEPAALEVEPELAGWRDAFHEAVGVRPKLAGSGSTWFVEGNPEALGLTGRDSLELSGKRAALVPVRTVGGCP